MSYVTVHHGRVLHDTAEEAIKYAMTCVYLNPQHAELHLSQLKRTGNTAWNYGFSGISIYDEESAV